ncbi:hypothetical protein ABEB36_006782 [Hypothenemus hampei]|uniref:Uncharacterized protein n=1 Tax=Hypothenemus hampei TaxID=57062 RepID=A0ABD1ERQ6_HYPHA
MPLLGLMIAAAAAVAPEILDGTSDEKRLRRRSYFTIKLRIDDGTEARGHFPPTLNQKHLEGRPGPAQSTDASVGAAKGGRTAKELIISRKSEGRKGDSPRSGGPETKTTKARKFDVAVQRCQTSGSRSRRSKIAKTIIFIIHSFCSGKIGEYFWNFLLSTLICEDSINKAKSDSQFDPASFHSSCYSAVRLENVGGVSEITRARHDIEDLRLAGLRDNETKATAAPGFEFP